MKLTLDAHHDLPELEQLTQQTEAAGLTDTTHQVVYGGMTRTRRVLTLGESLFIAHTTIETQNELVLMVDNPNAGMEMHLNLSGSAYSQFDGKRVGFDGAQHNQLFFAGFRQSIHYAPDKSYACLEIDCWPLTDLRNRLAYRPEALDENIARVEAGQTFSLGQPRPILMRQQQVIYDLLHCPLTGPHRRVYVEAKVWELYALQAGQFTPVVSDVVKFSPQDIEKLHYVRELVESSIDNPASLLELARQTGINLDKLKRGFKAVFGTTIFGYLHQLRMQKAYELLVGSTYLVAEVSVLVGYKNPQHFTAAFKKQYGYLPSALRK